MEQRLGAGQSEALSSCERNVGKKPVILFMGVEGSGKSVHSEEIAQIYGLSKVVMGDEFRKTAELDNTELGIACRRILQEGIYADDELFWRVFDNRFDKDDVKDGVVIDGAFRAIGQIKGFREKIQEYIGDADITVIFLRAPIWQGAFRAIERGGRYDTPEIVLSRQNSFFKGLGERISLIKENFRFMQIMTGNKSIREVREEIRTRYEEVSNDGKRTANTH